MFKSTSLPDFILKVVRDKGTELPFNGQYDQFGEPGSYLCRQCGLALFRAKAKFPSGCGWPSFDEALPGAVASQLDADGRRTEILCNRCGAHLGHVFSGEHLTEKNKRYCVNSLSVDHVASLTVQEAEEALFAAGCFWGVEYYFKQFPGVIKTEVGYSGGQEPYPNYKQVCRGATGHYEVVRVLFNPEQCRYADLVRFFFEIHDPTQTDGQGPDLGEQYLSVIFYYNEEQEKTVLEVFNELVALGYPVVTKVLPVSAFWPAEDDHQSYYQKTGKMPYCHRYQKKFHY